MAGAVLRSSERPPTSGTTPPSTRGNTPQSDGPHGSSAVARLAGRASRSEGAMIRRAISAHPPGLYPCGSAASVARGMCSDKGIRRELAVGDSFNLVRTFTAEDVAAFSAVSLDQNPLHSDAAAARTAAFEAPVVHGMLVASMFSAIIGNTFPGSVYLSQTLKFVAPVAVGATVTAQVEVLKLKRLGGNVVASWKTTCTAAPRGGEPPRALIEGQALCRLPAATVP